MLKIVASLIPMILCLQAAEPLIVAHRGASGQAPENTIPAFNLAWKEGADAIEADFLMTKDGHIICIHDKDTQRVSNQKLTVRNSTLEQLKKLDVGSWKHPRYAGTRIPTIAEVFATIPMAKKIYIEVKAGPEIVPQLLIDIKKSKLTHDQIVVISFNPHVLLAIKNQAPELKTLWLCSFKQDKQGHAKPTPQDASLILQKIQAKGISTSSKLMSAEFIDYFKSQGFEHHVWTVDDPEHAKHLKIWGTQSITTNYPLAIRKAISPAQQKVR